MSGVEPIQMLLVEDQPADVRLTREILSEGRVANELHVAGDGEQALMFLHKEGMHASAPRPDLVLLDLHLPKVNGREVLAAMRADPNLAGIPVIILTTSLVERDILQDHRHHVRAYLTKPLDLSEFVEVVTTMERFWLSIVRVADGDDRPAEPT